MATMRGNPRLQVGSAAWITEERSSAAQIAETEVEEFTFSARNEVEWLNEHMAEIFSKNQVNVAEIFKTPGKLRGKTPRTIRKVNPSEGRAPLSDIFSTTPRGGLSGLSPVRQTHFDLPSFRVAEDAPISIEPVQSTNILEEEDLFRQKPAPNYTDSGYFGSQYASQQTQPTQPNDPIELHQTPRSSSPKPVLEVAGTKNVVLKSPESEERRSTEGSFHSAREEQTRTLGKTAIPHPAAPVPSKSPELIEYTRPVLESLPQTRTQLSSPRKRSPIRSAVPSSPTKVAKPVEELSAIDEQMGVEDEPMEDVADNDNSPSEGSSPIRPIVRKSSLNFASLPAREPITTKKSIGNRVSRTSHLDQTRTSYYGRQTGGKSLGNTRIDTQDNDDDEMDIDAVEDEQDPVSRLHNKTSTQRLQDQISMLGKSQAGGRPASKSIASTVVALSQAPTQVQPIQEAPLPKSPHKSPIRSPERKPFAAPGAFPEDEDDSWIGPSTAAAGPSIFSPRPGLIKSHTTDVMEDIRGKDSIGGSEFNIPKRGESPRHRSPIREPTIPERTTSTLGHMKSVSTSVLRSPKKSGDSPFHKKTISVSNPNPSSANANDVTPPKSPSKSYKGSPLKAAKDKFSSILKTSRGLFASSAAVSAEAKSSAMSPAPSRMGMISQPSFEEALQANANSLKDSQSSSLNSQRVPDSPGKASVRKTRASTEREERRKEEQAREAKQAKETKEAQKMADQLEKARQKVKEEARVFHLEQERVAAMQKQVNERKEQEILAKASQVDIPRATRSSPRKTKAQLEAEGIAAAAASVEDMSGKDVEMTDAQSMPPPPTVPRPKSQIGRPVAKRPLKPTKEVAGKQKPPTVIRVDTGSQRGHIGQPYHPSNSTLAATLQESLGPAAQPVASQAGLRKKASTSSMASTASKGNNFKSAATKALEAAARKKEQDELAAKRKKEAKEEVERQRAAIKEEERRKEEQQRRQELERQRAIQRDKEQAAQAADAKKSASRQAIEKRRLEMEKAKQTGAPPPALRSQPSGDLDKPLPSIPRGEFGQSKGPHLNGPPKRPLPQDNGDDHHSRPIIPRNLPSYQHNDNQSKRRKTSDNFDDDEDLTEPRPKMTAPPIRQSSSRAKELQPKSIFSTGYANAPPPGSLQRATLIQQHNMNQSKPAHPLDMAQVSKAPIPFASSSNYGNPQHKTPARPINAQHGGKSSKSTAKSSPRYQNGENIELPEINTDSEDEDDDDEPQFPTQAWTNSPDLRKQLARQEEIDPSLVFGQPGPLNMEEVFSKSKDRFHKFRQRTSSANWSGQDRLTEDEVRRDLEARDRVRRQGGWTYDSMV
ncbi:hypothetical protein B0O99DRAFT_508595 [Bisporella sp. PMI_857]|nr:hypothetical protein B0O99DRAFT_508595 [Bisporella sp. PMI_857]